MDLACHRNHHHYNNISKYGLYINKHVTLTSTLVAKRGTISNGYCLYLPFRVSVGREGISCMLHQVCIYNLPILD